MDEQMTDESLMLAYAEGDANAFEILYVRHKGPVYRYLLNLCRNEAVAEELFQDVWMKLINSRESYVVSAKFTTYLYKLAHNHFIDHYRKQSVRIVTDDSMEPEEVEELNVASNTPQTEMQFAQTQTEFNKILEDLPHEQREVFLLREETNMSLQEIANTIGINHEAAKSRLRYAIRKLKEGLSKE